MEGLRRWLLVVVVSGVLALAGCGEPDPSTAPTSLDDGWETSSLDAERLDSVLVTKAVERIKDGTYTNIDSLVIVRNGKLDSLVKTRFEEVLAS